MVKSGWLRAIHLIPMDIHFLLFNQKMGKAQRPRKPNREKKVNVYAVYTSWRIDTSSLRDGSREGGARQAVK